MNLSNLIKKFDIETVAMLYRAFGEDTVRRMITPPRSQCESIARRNGDDPKQMIAKRDKWVEATLDFAAEIANLDND